MGYERGRELPDGKREVDAGLEIGFGGCVHIDLANGDVATILIEDSEGVRCQQVIVDLLGRPAVLEDDESNRRSGGRT